MILMVSQVRKVEAIALQPTDRPRKMVTMLHSAFCAVSDRRSVRPHSRSRLPSMSMPISGAVSGMSRMTTVATAIGKMIFSVLETGRSCSILISRSFRVVSRRMIGGWMSGMSAM